MTPFTTLRGIAAPLPLAHIDTDAIMPKQFLKTIQRTGLGRFLFWDMRYDGAGTTRPDFVLNRPPYRNASILIAGANFGCGSSREHAPWGLADFGIRCVVAPSFADIFAGNCVKNGILCAVVPSEDIARLAALAAEPETATMTVDLPHNRILCGGKDFTFTVDDAVKHTLLSGLDEISATVQRLDRIEAFEAARARSMPWWTEATR